MLWVRVKAMNMEHWTDQSPWSRTKRTMIEAGGAQRGERSAGSVKRAARITTMATATTTMAANTETHTHTETDREREGEREGDSERGARVPGKCRRWL